MCVGVWIGVLSLIYLSDVYHTSILYRILCLYFIFSDSVAVVASCE